MKTGIELQDKTTRYTDGQLAIVLSELWNEGRLIPGEYSELAYCLEHCLFLEDQDPGVNTRSESGCDWF